MFLLGIELIGILAPIVLLGDWLFSGPHHAPTLQGQYVLKDVILVAAVLVIAATVGGGRLTTTAKRQRQSRGSHTVRQPATEEEADGR